MFGFVSGRSVVLAAVACVVLGSSVVPVQASGAAAAVRAATTCPGFVAHRGEITPPDNFTEDGLFAERLGINDPSYVAVEDDAWPTSDGKFLMMHDSTVDATSDSTGPISGHTLAYWQATIHLKDGSVPMSLPEYLALFSTYQLGHGYLHVKSRTALTEMAHELNVAGVQKYVRVMASTAFRLKTLHSLAPAYLLEYGVSTAIDSDTANQISIAKTYGQKRILLAKPDWTPTVTALNAVFAAGLTVDWTTYGPSQDTVATQWNFARVLTFDVAHLRALYPTAVCP